MNIKIDKSFQKDVKKIKEKNIRIKIAGIIKNVQHANNRSEIRNIKKLTGSLNEYRIKVGDYRIGLIISEDNVELIRFLHRKDIYKYFPK
jgi:mRNA interferase RelE/StbE